MKHPDRNELTFEDLISQQESSVAPRRKKRAREPDAGTLPAIEGQQTRSQRASDRQKKAQPTEHKKESKHRPSEASSRRPVKRFREVVEGTNRSFRDPRFDSLAGTFEEGKFRKQYGFIYDEQLPQEQVELQHSLKKSRSVDRRKELKLQLKSIQQQLADDQRNRTAQQKAEEQKAKEREDIQAGKRPFFLKASEKRKQALIQRYHELKASGKLEKAMAKRRKKMASKDHRLVPRGRRMVE